MAEAPGDDGRLAAMTGRGQRDNYRTGANLARRQALFAHAVPARSSGTPPIERIAWCGDERALDAGCGNGLWLRTLAERFGVGDVVGVDLSTGMLADAWGLAGDAARLVAGDVRRLPFADGTFDAVLCFWMLYHVPDQDALGQPVDWPAVEAEVRRRLEAVIAKEGAFWTELVSVSFLCS